MAKFIEINTKEDFLLIKSTGDYVLTQDIDMGGDDIKSIKKFTGQFDGQGHTLSNFILKSDYSGKYAGLFERVSGKGAKISNLNIKSVKIAYTYETFGLIVGHLSEGAEIDNCTVEDSVLDINHAMYGTAFICGASNAISYEGENCKISNCKVINCVTAGSAIAGRMYYTDIENCTVEKCKLTGYSGSIAYGLSYNSTLSNCLVKDCELSSTASSLLKEMNKTIITNSKVIIPKIKTSLEIICEILTSDNAYDQLKDEESLSLWGLYTDPNKLAEIPEVVFQLKNLKRLNIGNNNWKSIPEKLTQLENLEELQLDAALSYIENIPDLSKFKKLKILRANGVNWLDSRPLPSQNLLPQLLKANQVEVLSLSNWGEVVREGKKIRPSLALESLAALENMKHLKMLILSHCGLEQFPEFISNLKLEYINLSNNKLAGAFSLKLKENNPNIVVEASKNKPINTGFGDFGSISAMAESGAGLLHMDNVENLKKAQIIFAEVIKTAVDNPESEKEFPVQYAYYGTLYAYIYLTTRHAGYYTKPELKKAQEAKLVFARKVVSLVENYPDIMTFSPLSGLQADMLRQAGNTLGWEMFETAKKPEQLEEGLKFIQLAVNNIAGFEHYFIYDTQVRLLLKANRVEEAYTIVQKCLKMYPDFSDFRDIKNSDDYNTWVNNEKE